jgi:hypothetical protein
MKYPDHLKNLNKNWRIVLGSHPCTSKKNGENTESYMDNGQDKDEDM